MRIIDHIYAFIEDTLYIALMTVLWGVMCGDFEDKYRDMKGSIILCNQHYVWS